MRKIIVIVGPTGVGKTKLSIELAKKFNGEIINADSTQVYKNMNIATAKVTEEEKEGIKHYLLDIKDITEDYSVCDFQHDARECIDTIQFKNKLPIIVGGTGLYIKALLYDYKFDDNNKKYDYSNLSNEELYNKLISIKSNSNIHKNNRKRIERALDIYQNTGKIIENENKTEKLLYDSIIIGLTTNRDNLYNRINKRVDEMFKQGLLAEAKSIYDTNVRTKAVLTPIGYKELFDYFDGNKSLDDCVELIKQKSRRYAKRQYTWFNNQMDVNWFNVDYNNFNNTINDVFNYIKEEFTD